MVLDRWNFSDIVNLGQFMKRWRVKEEVIKAVVLPDGLRWRTGNSYFRVVFFDAFLRPFAVGADRDPQFFMQLALHCGIPKLANVVHTEHLIADGAYSFQRVRDCIRSCEHHIRQMREQRDSGHYIHRVRCPYCPADPVAHRLNQHVMDIHREQFMQGGFECEKCHLPVRGPTGSTSADATYHASVCPFMDGALYDDLLPPNGRVFPVGKEFHRRLRRGNGINGDVALQYNQAGDFAFEIHGG
ncbi:uncharacterized protein LOC129597637 [Paramacrobiotus metropolitanus]|uniref:uncharacterized protein LOC129597637 n=1 Tax=Paramacrobiotus metropolitanus TaxID=2943436 RepID=UPI002445AD60|nr:uncharacterized protein LOC129597637 [Paramacrobiotus metropolitanus]